MIIKQFRSFILLTLISAITNIHCDPTSDVRAIFYGGTMSMCDFNTMTDNGTQLWGGTKSADGKSLVFGAIDPKTTNGFDIAAWRFGNTHGRCFPGGTNIAYMKNFCIVLGSNDSVYSINKHLEFYKYTGNPNLLFDCGKRL